MPDPELSNKLNARNETDSHLDIQACLTDAIRSSDRFGVYHCSRLGAESSVRDQFDALKTRDITLARELVSNDGVRPEVLQSQAARIGLPLEKQRKLVSVLLDATPPYDLEKVAVGACWDSDPVLLEGIVRRDEIDPVKIDEIVSLCLSRGKIDLVSIVLDYYPDKIEMYAPLHHQSSEEWKYLASEILRYTRSKERCFQWMQQLAPQTGATFQKIQTTDAFESPAAGAATYLGSSLLRAARVACELPANGSLGDVRKREAFVSLMLNDIDRVENTPGLSYRKLAESLRHGLGPTSLLKDVTAEVFRTLHLSNTYKPPPYPISFPLNSWDAKVQVLRGKSTPEVIALSKKWHHPDSALPAELQPCIPEAAWHALFEPVVTDNGLTVQCITSKRDLEQEGKVLEHCVGRGGYQIACESGETQIVSIRENETPIATLELGWEADYENTNPTTNEVPYRLYVVQFQGNRNGSPSAIAKGAWAEVEALLRSGAIPLNTETGRIEDGPHGRFSRLEQHIGYPVAEAKRYQKAILHHYQNTVVVYRGRNGSRRVPLIDHPTKGLFDE